MQFSLLSPKLTKDIKANYFNFNTQKIMSPVEAKREKSDDLDQFQQKNKFIANRNGPKSKNHLHIKQKVNLNFLQDIREQRTRNVRRSKKIKNQTHNGSVTSTHNQSLAQHSQGFESTFDPSLSVKLL